MYSLLPQASLTTFYFIWLVFLPLLPLMSGYSMQYWCFCQLPYPNPQTMGQTTSHVDKMSVHQNDGSTRTSLMVNCKRDSEFLRHGGHPNPQLVSFCSALKHIWHRLQHYWRYKNHWVGWPYRYGVLVAWQPQMLMPIHHSQSYLPTLWQHLLQFVQHTTYAYWYTYRHWEGSVSSLFTPLAKHASQTLCNLSREY